MSNAPIIEDNSPYLYGKYRDIWQRCRESLARLDTTDPLFDSVAALCVMAKAEMERHAKNLPF